MRRVVEHFGERLQIYAGTRATDPSIRLISPQTRLFLPLRNRLLPANVVLQFPPLRRMIAARTVLLDLNPRMPSVWVIVLLRRALRRRTVLWGHAWPRAGRDAGGRLRSVLRSLADGLVTYTETQARELAAISPDKPIWAAPNALYMRSECSYAHGTERNSVVYVGRLHPEKKPLLLVRAFALVAQTAENIVLEVVGDGPEMAEVEATAARLGMEDRVVLHGHKSGIDELRSIYARALVSVSPGYVGLSITQSFAFGVPMVIARDEPHAPEIEAAVPGENCLYFDEDDEHDLARKLRVFVDDRDAWAARGPSIARDCADHYSVEAMSDGLIRALESRRP